MITLQCLLEFETEADRAAVMDLMRRWSACERYAYKRLLEGADRNQLKRDLPEIFNLNTRYVDDAIKKAQEIIKSRRELGLSARKIIFGGRDLFEKLKKKHLNGKRREELKRRWRERRQGMVFSRGDRSKKGNLNLRFEFWEGKLFLRINLGNGEYVRAPVRRKIQPGRILRDKWVDFVLDLMRAEASGLWFPYSVALKLRNGRIYVFVSVEEPFYRTKICLDDGVLGLDVNASPFHLAWAEVGPDGNLVSSGRIDLSELIGKTGGERDNLIWQKAYEVVELAKKKGRAIVLEDLQKLSKGRRGDGMAKLRKRLHQFVYRKLLERIEVLGRREEIGVVRKPAAWSSVIGALKYAPQYGLDKDQAAALVMARRGLGFWENVPKKYRELLGDREFLEYALFMWRERKKELKKKAKAEKNRWKRRALQKKVAKATGEIRALRSALKNLESPKSNPLFPKGASHGKKLPEGRRKLRRKGWRVLRAALVFPLLGKSFVRDFSPLKPVLVSGDWKRRARAPAPVPGAGADRTTNNCAV